MPKFQPSLSERSAGILLHITSLPEGRHLGDLGDGSHRFIDWLAAAQMRWWQMLPVNPVGPGNSPYSTIAALAGEPLLIGLEPLVQKGWLNRRDVSALNAKAPSTKANFVAAQRQKWPLFKKAFAKAQIPKSEAFRAFQRREQYWLRDTSLFMALSDHFKTKDWTSWPAPLRQREKQTLKNAAESFAEEIAFIEFLQFVFDEQWRQLKQYAADAGIGLIGDIPIFVAHESADVWAHQDIFRLDRNGKPTVVAGCPPDAFNEEGQLWGNALYDWQALKKTKFSWWMARLSRMFELFDAVRLDHFIGFYRYWEIKAGAVNARQGKWQLALGDDFFKAVQRKFPKPQFIAEDLGAVIPPVRELRDRFGFPGMKVLQFAFDGTDESFNHKPHLLPQQSVVYTGTHDNPTTGGWMADLQDRAKKDPNAQRELAYVLAYFGCGAEQVPTHLIRAALGSQAHLAILPFQEWTGSRPKDRMNVPGTATGNWAYRAKKEQISREKGAEIARVLGLYDRAGDFR